MRCVTRRWARGARRILVASIATLMLAGLPAAPSTAEQSREGTTSSEESLTRRLEQLEKLLAELTEARKEEIAVLEARIAELEAELQRLRRSRDQDSLDDLRREAEEATTEQTEKEEATAEQRKVFVGRQRTQQALNPEISFLGDVSYDWSDTAVRDGFLLRGAEIALQAPLDPYTRFKAYLSGHQEPAELEQPTQDPGAEPAGHVNEGEINVSIEEAYMEWVALPLNTRLRVGKFRQQFGTLNRWHPHALPSADLPFALRNTFGHEGLMGLGLGLDWQLPGLWATSHGLNVEIVNADNDAAFSGSSFRDPAFLLRHTGFFDLGPDTFFELGLNGMIGANDESGGPDTTLAGLDFNFVWEPVARAKYRGAEIRAEYIHSRFETEAGPVDTDSWYAYFNWKLSRRWLVGLRYDDAELPSPRVELIDGQAFGEGLRERAISPYVTFWQSEWVRLRAQYQHATRDFVSHTGPDDDDRLWLQVTFAAGPHKHEAY